MLLTILVELVISTAVATHCHLRDSDLWSYYDKHCYYVAPWDDLRTYDDASQGCHDLGSDLLSVTSLAEKEFISSLFQCWFCYLDNYRFWIGLRKHYSMAVDGLSLQERRANWTWQSGEPYRWQNWYYDRPDTDSGYGRMNYNGRWTDKDPGSKYRYICKKADLETTTWTEFVTSRMSPSLPLVGSPAVSPPPTTIIHSPYHSPNGQMSTTGIQDSSQSSHPPTTYPRSHGSSTSTQADNKTFIYVGVVLGLLLVTGIAVVVSVSVWKRRTSKPNPIAAGPAPREENQYVELGKAPQVPTNDTSDYLRLPPINPPSISVNGGVVSALYAVPHRSENTVGHRDNDDDDDDDEVTVVENSAYSSY